MAKVDIPFCIAYASTLVEKYLALQILSNACLAFAMRISFSSSAGSMKEIGALSFGSILLYTFSNL